jgi:hypothetical protein
MIWPVDDIPFTKIAMKFLSFLLGNEVLKAVSHAVTLCSAVDGCQCFGGKRCLSHTLKMEGGSIFV